MENIVSTYDDDEVDFIVCDVCNIKIRTDAMYRIHLTTIQHLKKVEALIAAGKARRDQPLPVWTSYTHYLDYLQLDEPIIGLKHLVEVETPPGSLGPRYLCRLCRFDADLPDMTNHIIGRKHRQKYLETQRPDLVTWDRSSASQPGKVVRAKAEVAERQDGRGVPERSKRRSAALGKPGTLKVPSPQWRGGQTSAQGGARGGLANKPVRPSLDQHGHARYRDPPPGWGSPREESYGRGHPEHLPESFASGEEWRAEQPRRRRSLEKEGGFYPHGLLVDSQPAYHHGDGMYPENKEERRGRIYEDEPRRGGVYEDEGRRGGVYEGEERRSGAYEGEGRRGGAYEGEGRRGGVYEDEGRRGGAYEGEGRRGGAYEGVGGRGGVYEGKGRRGGAYEGEERRGGAYKGEDSRGGAYSCAEPGRDVRMSGGQRNAGNSEQEVEGTEWLRGPPAREGPPARGGPTTVNELPETFRRFLSGAAEKRRVSRFSQDTEPSRLEQYPTLSREAGLDSKKLKLDLLNFGKVDFQGMVSESGDVLDDLRNIDIGSVEEANFIKEKLCNLLREFQANKSQRERAGRKSPSGFYRDYNHLSSQQQGPSTDHSHVITAFQDPQDHYERDQSDPQDHYERALRDPQDHIERGQRDPQDRFEKGRRDPQDHFLRGQRDQQDHQGRGRRDSQDHFERGQRDSQDHFERGQRDSQDHFERGQRDQQDHLGRGRRDSEDHFEKGWRDSQDHFERGQRDQQDHLGRGQRDSQDRFEKGWRDSQDHFERGRKNSQDRFERGQRDSQDHFERGQRDQQDHLGRGRRGSQDPFERDQRGQQDHLGRGQRDSQDRYEEYGRGRKDHYDPVRSRERSDPRATHRDSYEDVFGKAAPDTKSSPVRRGVHNYPQSSSLPDVWSPKQRLDRMQPTTEFDPRLPLPPTPPQRGHSGPKNSASLEKITSTLLQMVARNRPF